MTSLWLMLCQCWSKKAKPPQLNMAPVQIPVRKVRILTVVQVEFELELELCFVFVILIGVLVEEEEQDEDTSL
jgi:hypothetical protein